MAGRWRPRWPATVRVRLTVLATLVVGVGLVAGGLVVLALVRHNLVANVHNDALRRAYATAALVASAGPPGTIADGGDDAAVVQVVDRGGVVLAASEALRGVGPVVWRWPEDTFETTVSHPWLDEGADHVVVGVAVHHAGRPLAVYVAASLDPAEEGVAAVATALALVVPALLALVTYIAWVLVGRALRPV